MFSDLFIMEAIIVSLLYYSYVILVCEAARQFTNVFVRSHDARGLIIEFLGTLQICACLFENEFVYSHYGLTALFLAIFILVVVHLSTIQTAHGNPCALFEQIFAGTIALSHFIAKMTMQLLAAYCAFHMARLFWNFEMSVDHKRNFSQFFCYSHIKVPVMKGVFAEFVASFTARLIAQKAKARLLRTSKYVIGLSAAAISSLGLEYTGMYFNPILASSRLFGCPGSTVVEHFTVYWLGPILGFILATTVHRSTREIL